MNKKNNPLLWLKKADKIATYSKDQSTKVGALFTDKNDLSPITWGYNGMSRGMPDKDRIKNERPEKYKWIEHAERNAFYNLAQADMNNCLMISSRFPNMEAARAIVNVGIKTVYVKSIPTEKEEIDSLRVQELFGLANVQLISFAQDGLFHKREKIKGFMELCDEYAEDFSSSLLPKSASMILKPYSFSYVSMGESGPPPNITVPENVSDEQLAYWVQESEKNAIFNFLRPKLNGSHGYVSWCPCAHCSLAITSVGCEKVFSYKPDFRLEAEQRWKASFEQSEKTMKAHGVELILLEKEN